MNSLRIFFVGGYLAYRALFNWIHWTMYVPTMLGGPIFQILFFAYIGRYAGSQSDKFFLVGNAVAICSLGGGIESRMARPCFESWLTSLKNPTVTRPGRAG